MQAHLVGIRKIWNAAPHNAFTSLACHGGHWYCTFREATSHMSEDGALRIIRSQDGISWQSVARLTSPNPQLPDLRDPKIISTAKNGLLLMGGATSRSEAHPRRSYIWSSPNGRDWSLPATTGNANCWLWSLTREGTTYYSASYTGSQADPQSVVSLYRSTAADHRFEHLAILHTDAQYPNETALLMSNGHGLAIIRRELAPGQTTCPPYNNGTALIATSTAPYTEWTATDLGLYLGGPQLLKLPNGKILASARAVTSAHYTGLWEVGPTMRSIRELLLLPSGGDCAYPGMAWHNDRLWISYYSTHERQSSIYLAEVQLEAY